jgi:hypothetical protein
MSRYYRLCVVAVGITEEQLMQVCSNEFGWDGSTSSWEDQRFFEGEGSLYGGRSEQEAHEEIYAAIQKIKSDAKIKTRWTYLEDLPYEEYGDDIE